MARPKKVVEENILGEDVTTTEEVRLPHVGEIVLFHSDQNDELVAIPAIVMKVKTHKNKGKVSEVTCDLNIFSLAYLNYKPSIALSAEPLNGHFTYV